MSEQLYNHNHKLIQVLAMYLEIIERRITLL